MQNHTKFPFVPTFLLLALAAFAAPAAVVIPFNSAWKFYVATNEASNPVDAWRAIAFDDSGWGNGPTPIGYDTLGTPGLDPIATSLPTGSQGKYSSACFRQAFNVAHPSDVLALQLDVRIDDGFVAWLNGTEVGRYNVVAGDLAYNATALVARETTNVTVAIPSAPSLLVAGANVITIQGFNKSGSDNDFIFDAMLSSSSVRPVVLETHPVQNSITPELGFIDVTFDRNVTGVDTTDLLINGSAIVTNLAVLSPREYTFYFPAPPTGAVSVAFAPGHGIQDLSDPALTFGGASWGYTFDPEAVLAPLLITEFMSDNVHGINDEDGTRADWIELYNPGPVDVDLGGWFLTNTETNLTEWRFPSVNLAPKKYLLVWASKKDRTNSFAPLHTNFKLDKNGGFLALVDRRGTVVSDFAPSYPLQTSDVSYGRDKDNPSSVGFYTTPTPGKQNSTSGSGFAPEVQMSLESGIYTDNSLVLTLSAPAGATIRYTTDGNVPATNSLIYTNSLSISNSTTFKARTFQAGVFPGPVGSRTFIMLDDTTRDFSSELPILVISTGGKPIPSDVLSGAPRQPGTLAVIDTFRGRSSFQVKPDFQGLAEFEIFGQTSASFPKLPFRIEVQDALRNDNKVSFLGLPPESDWKLRNPYSDKCMMNDFLGYELFEQMGNYSCRRRLVEVFVDTGGGKLKYPADYVGIEVLFETIKVSKDRVNIAELTPANTNEPAISGGYIFKKDKDSTGDRNFSTSGGAGFSGEGLKVHEPKPRAVTDSQVNWLTKYLNRFEASMYANNWTNATGTNHYSNYIDVDAFVDQHWIVEFTRQIDGYRLSDYFHKDRNGKVKPEPIWDWNLSFGNADYLNGGRFAGWYFSDLGDADHIWLRRLITGRPGSSPIAGDPEFKQKIVDRWGVLRTNVMNGPRVIARIDELANLLTEAANRDFKKWPRLGTYIWPNPKGAPDDIDYQNPTTYAGIISEMKKWVGGRYNWIETQFTKQPAMNQNGGSVSPGFNLVLGAPEGSIYYTLDGSDPRAAGGGIASGALLYTAPVALAANARVFARAVVANQTWGWSPPTIATFVVATPKLVITEIMYHPAPAPAGSPYAADDFEFIELQNIGQGLLDVNGYRLSGGVEFTFPALTLNANQRVVVVKNSAAFVSRYGGTATIAGQYVGNLKNSGDHLSLVGPLQENILDFNYQDSWYPITDGPGFSLVIVNPSAALDSWGAPASWRPSGVAGGSPGAADSPLPSFPGILVNEILANSGPGLKDKIELYNPTASSVDLAGWFLTDDSSAPKKFRLPSGTQIPASGYRVFTSDDFNPTPGAGTSFGLGANGGQVYLFSGDALSNLTGYMDGFTFGASDQGVSLGRYVRSDYQVDHPAQHTDSFDAANSGPSVGPVVISEIMFHPAELAANGAVWDNTDEEFIELHNLTGSPVPLHDPSHPTNTWTLKAAVTFAFPTNVTLAAQGYMLIVSFDPAAEPARLSAFRSRYGLNSSLPIYGPYARGPLDNTSANLELAKPGVPDAVSGLAPYILVDKVHYHDSDQWPVLADGSGASLQRRNSSAYGNDPANWAAALPSPGATFLAGAAPNIQTQPMSQTRIAGGDAALFTVVAQSPSPLAYQWRFKGISLPNETNSTLTITEVTAAKAGDYGVVIMTAGAATISTSATLTVLVPAQIVTQPASQTVDPGADVTLNVEAIGTGTLRYQWKFNDSPLSGETNNVLHLPRIQLDRAGSYAVVASNDYGVSTSDPANVIVKVKPFIVTQPESQIAVQGDTVLLSVVAAPQHPTLRLSYKWRKGSLAISRETNSTLTLTNVQLSQAANYNVIVTNLAGSVTSANAVLTVLADADGDHVPDEWEIANGFDPNNPADGALDPDGDGFNNYQEYIAGTDPHDASSYLQVGHIGREPSGISLEFLAVSNKTYSILYTTNLTATPWWKLADVGSRPTNWVSIITDPGPANPERYYRLLTPKRP